MWMMAGDLNDIPSNEEKWGGRSRPDSSFKDFREFIESNALIDLGFEGVPWTWSNQWEGGGLIQQRLDRCLANQGWIQQFKDARCTHVHKEASDHCIVLMDTEPAKKKYKRRFHFDQRWTYEEETNTVISNAWKEHQQGSRFF
ncbi:uncharacterized protein LOC113766707 [Coffea eugenioides]|uniref:uncharacterized protein LOC113766707 n=1 Tax=Coffea eugenioides TaxID=49369 RepID=UPI000F6095B6|nr:uncharacterized protein LOC113766707 [Coffea eugenioides]